MSFPSAVVREISKPNRYSKILSIDQILPPHQKDSHINPIWIPNIAVDGCHSISLPFSADWLCFLFIHKTYSHIHIIDSIKQRKKAAWQPQTPKQTYVATYSLFCCLFAFKKDCMYCWYIALYVWVANSYNSIHLVTLAAAAETWCAATALAYHTGSRFFAATALVQ